MEMERVPKAGYEIVGLNIAGIQRRLTWKNLLVPFKIISSLMKARGIIKDFAPDVAIGVGGYASGPLLRVASSMKVSTLLQEQNSYPGITNKLLAKKANRICVAYDNMQRFFDESKIEVTGNPIRSSVTQIEGKKEEALRHFGLEKDKLTVLVIGGSLGARSMNNAIQNGLSKIKELDVQLLWQTGKFYFDEMEQAVKEHSDSAVHVTKFIDRMDLAYSAADIVVSRAGAISISELCLVSKPTILVPSPNVSEDHQTKNAMALVNKEAAILAKDNELDTALWESLQSLVQSPEKRSALSKNIRTLGRPDATKAIVDEIHKLLK
jgi:UDP-N-acetylglucosamine--N-acetylmuramyl-(pentapeptide) pyrophosphoryl-undecaprenol N-acetylglucosamine transferase